MSEPNKRKTKKKIFLNLLYIGLTIGVIVVIGFLDPSVTDFFSAIGSLKIGWILAAAGACLINFLFEGVAVHNIMRFVHPNFSLGKSIKNGIIGIYYSALTPFSSGGQPVQVMYMKKDGVPIGTSTSVFCIKFVIFEAVICLFFVFSLLFRGLDFFTDNAGVFPLTCIGFVANALITGIVILAMVKQGPLLTFATRVVWFLHKIHLVKHPERAVISLANTLEDFHKSAAVFKHDLRMFLSTALIILVQMFAYFAVTFFIYKAFGLKGYNLFEIVALQSFLYLTVSFVPLPGASVASEGGFYLFFAQVFPAELKFVTMILWRFFTYYANIIFGALFVLGDSLTNVFRAGKAASPAKINGRS